MLNHLVVSHGISVLIARALTLCIRETFANSEDQDEMQLRLHFIRVYTVCKGNHDLQTKECNIVLKNCKLIPLDMYTVLSQILYQTRWANPLVYKGLRHTSKLNIQLSSGVRGLNFGFSPYLRPSLYV